MLEISVGHSVQNVVRKEAVEAVPLTLVNLFGHSVSIVRIQRRNLIR